MTWDHLQLRKTDSTSMVTSTHLGTIGITDQVVRSIKETNEAIVIITADRYEHNRHISSNPNRVLNIEVLPHAMHHFSHWISHNKQRSQLPIQRRAVPVGSDHR